MTGNQATDAPPMRIAPPEFLAEPAFAALLDALPAARIIGGAVRDALAEHPPAWPATHPPALPPADIDLAIPLPPVAVMATLQRAGIHAVPTGLAHGTVTAVLDGTSTCKTVEITTLRRDVATDGRHAIVAFTDDWRQDAARRDFTINAMSMTRDGAVYDYFGGVEDLRAGIVRFVGDPAKRIAEDYLRVLRYFRFAARYAAQPPTPTPAVQAALRAGIPGLAQLSAERVWSELQRILGAPDPRAAVELMAALDILAAVIPEGADPDALARLIAAGAPVDPLMRLAALLTGGVESFADRLRLSAEQRQRLLDLRATPLAHPCDDDATLRRLLADHARQTLVDRTWLAHTGPDTMTDAAADGRWTALRDRLNTLAKPRFPLEGRDVLAMGVAPGPRVGALLRSIRAWWLAGDCTADAESCRAELSRQIDLQYVQFDNEAQIDIATQTGIAATDHE